MVTKAENAEYLLEKATEKLEQAYGYLDRAMEEGQWNHRQWNDLGQAREQIQSALGWIDPTSR